MGNAISAAAAPALCAAMSSLCLINLLDPQHGAGTTAAAEASALRGAVGAFLPYAAAAGLLAFFASVAAVYRHLRRAGAAAAAGGGNRRLPEHVTFTLCASAGFLQLLVSVVAGAGPGGAVDHGGAASALGLAAIRALPAAATASFYLGILLIIIRHIRAGGEGGGGAVVAGHEAIEAPVRLLAKMAVAAAAAVVFLMATAICFMFILGASSIIRRVS